MCYPLQSIFCLRKKEGIQTANTRTLSAIIQFLNFKTDRFCRTALKEAVGWNWLNNCCIIQLVYRQQNRDAFWMGGRHTQICLWKWNVVKVKKYENQPPTQASRLAAAIEFVEWFRLNSSWSPVSNALPAAANKRAVETRERAKHSHTFRSGMFASLLNETLGRTSIGDNDEWSVHNAGQPADVCKSFSVADRRPPCGWPLRDPAGLQPNRRINGCTGQLSTRFGHSPRTSPRSSQRFKRSGWRTTSRLSTSQISRLTSSAFRGRSRFASCRPFTGRRRRSPKSIRKASDKQWPVTCDACPKRRSTHPRPYPTVITSTTKPNLSIVLMKKQTNELTELVKRSSDAALTQSRSSILIYQLILANSHDECDGDSDTDSQTNSQNDRQNRLVANGGQTNREKFGGSADRWLVISNAFQPELFSRKPSLYLVSLHTPSKRSWCLNNFNFPAHSSISNCSDQPSFFTCYFYPNVCTRFCIRFYTNLYTAGVFYRFLSSADQPVNSRLDQPNQLDKQMNRTSNRPPESQRHNSSGLKIVSMHSADQCEQLEVPKKSSVVRPPAVSLPNSLVVVANQFDRLPSHLGCCLFVSFVTQLIVQFIGQSFVQSVVQSIVQLIVDRFKVAKRMVQPSRSIPLFSDHFEFKQTVVDQRIAKRPTTPPTNLLNQINLTAQQITICIPKQRILHRPNLSTTELRPTANLECPNQPNEFNQQRSSSGRSRSADEHFCQLRQTAEYSRFFHRPTNKQLSNSDRPIKQLNSASFAEPNESRKPHKSSNGQSNAHRQTGYLPTSYRPTGAHPKTAADQLIDHNYELRWTGSRFSYWLSILFILLSITCSVR